MNLDPSKEEYIPGGRSCVIGRLTRRSWRCNVCLDVHGTDNATTDYYGGNCNDDDQDECDCCHRTAQSLSSVINAAQQFRWSRTSRIEYLDEMGVRTAVRSRVY